MKFRNIIAIILLTLISSTAFAQLPVEVKGVLKTKRLTPVKLFKITEGKLVEISHIIPSVKGQFGFLFYPEYEGIYEIGTNTEMMPVDNYKFYFKGGEQLNVTLLDSSYVLNGKLNSKENIVLKQWHDLTNPLQQMSINFMETNSTFVDYFPIQEEIVAKAKTFLVGKATGNPSFDKKIKNIMDFDLAFYATNYLNTPRSAHPSVEEYSNFYNTLKTENFAKFTNPVYSYPWGVRTLSGLIMLNMRQQGKSFTAGLEGLASRASYVPNDTLKGDMVLDMAAKYKTYPEYQSLINAYGKFILTKSQKARSESIMAPLLTYKTGTDSYAFAYPDKNGNTITMASLKGKVVLVDVWATWCMPCRAEIPHLKKLEEEMKGKDVQIISLSIDEAKDKEKWLKMIKDENLGGLQLFAGGPSNEFSRYYKINAIPRFLVFDKNGKIVTVDSPRPSQSELKALLEKELAK